MSSEVLNIYKTPSSQFFEVISKCLNDVIRQDSVTIRLSTVQFFSLLHLHLHL